MAEGEPWRNKRKSSCGFQCRYSTRWHRRSWPRRMQWARRACSNPPSRSPRTCTTCPPRWAICKQQWMARRICICAACNIWAACQSQCIISRLLIFTVIVCTCCGEFYIYDPILTSLDPLRWLQLGGILLTMLMRVLAASGKIIRESCRSNGWQHGGAGAVTGRAAEAA